MAMAARKLQVLAADTAIVWLCWQLLVGGARDGVLLDGDVPQMERLCGADLPALVKAAC